jgi:two-component system, OmpR family, sensor histidine kinase ChvG
LAKTDEQDLSVNWTRRVAIRHRILAVNIFAILILAGSIFYLDSFRSRLTQARIEQAATEATMAARAIAAVPPGRREPLLVRLGQDSGTRLRVYGAEGARHADSWNGAAPTYEMRDPEAEPFLRDVGRVIDNVFDAIVGAARPPVLDTGVEDRLAAWPEAEEALRTGRTTTALRRAPEGSAYVSAAAPVDGAGGEVLLLSVNAREIRRVVRSERLALAIILIVTITLSILLSRFLARTIARPLRRLALAAHRVRLGRSREVDVPRLPGRRDEIGLLARALHDMTHTLRNRIDATEAFAADVTHELKNPLASLRSAVDSLERTKDPELQAQLLDIVRDDVKRLDRLVVEIAETSRVDAELSRARFEPIDLGVLVGAMVPGWELRAKERARIDYTPPRGGSAVIAGEESRLARLLDNLVDNAISFSPPGGCVRVRACREDNEVVVTVEDDGPGIPEEQRVAIFNRFHSVRPDEEFGRHSGLGLAIARAIAEGHGGTVGVGDRPDGHRGAWFELRLPLVQP